MSTEVLSYVSTRNPRAPVLRGQEGHSTNVLYSYEEGDRLNAYIMHRWGSTFGQPTPTLPLGSWCPENSEVHPLVSLYVT